MKRLLALGGMGLFLLLVGCIAEKEEDLSKVASVSMQETGEAQEEEILVGENISKTTGLETVNAMATFVGYANVDELDEASDLILIGTPTRDFIERASNNTYYSDGHIQDISTLTDFKIEHVIKNEEDVELEDVIAIIEPISIIEQNGVKTVLTVEDYVELQKGKTYIIFLGKNTYGRYSVINMNNGRFAIEEDGNLELAVMADSVQEKHSEFQKEVLEKYGLNP
ncbi:hypothetical protein [Saccharibacillus sacchari]|uniref:hypothetical protein n=1 Tax=Saccharibacillus sacchari TaxID=456493 RepID=UPI0004BA7964|nr:hypothetical protein [Saccharibacillus sacchari]